MMHVQTNILKQMVMVMAHGWAIEVSVSCHSATLSVITASCGTALCNVAGTIRRQVAERRRGRKGRRAGPKLDPNRGAHEHRLRMSIIRAIAL